jgi:hypothetical protein
LLAAVALHALLAVLIVSQVAPRPVEPPAIQVTLLDLPRQRSKPTGPPPPSTPAPLRPPTPTVRAPDRPEAPPPRVRQSAAPATDWRVDTSEPPETGAARATLRARLGCRTADLLALTKAERAACQDALAKGAENAPTYAVVSPKLRKVFDGTFECPKGDVWCEYRIGKAPYPGLFAPRKKPRDPTWD